MTIKWIARLLLLLVCVSSASGRAFLYQQTVTLYSPRDKETGKYDAGRSCFSFKRGVHKDGSDTQWDLAYGFASINNEDWFVLLTSNENRTVIKDLGEFSWFDTLDVPALEPLPLLAKGEKRQVTVDASGDTGKTWAKTTRIMAKVATGHMYVMRIKNEETDFYALFRVEAFEQGSFCTISWRLIPPPGN